MSQTDIARKEHDEARDPGRRQRERIGQDLEAGTPKADQKFFPVTEEDGRQVGACPLVKLLATLEVTNAGQPALVHQSGTVPHLACASGLIS